MTLKATTSQAFGWRFVLPLLAGSVLNPINTSLIATALVPIAAGIHVSVGKTAVLVSALYLASAIAQPTGGKLAEEFGPRRVLIVGMLCVLAGGLIGGLGQNLTTLVIGRVLIGVGSAAVYPSAMALIRRRASAAGLDTPPGGVLGALVITGSATAALGLPIGGVLVDTWGWRTAFLINIPVAAAALAMTLAWVPRDAPIAGPVSVREVATRIDVAGIVGFGGTIAALLVFLLDLPQVNLPALIAAILLGAALVWWERRATRPFLDVRLLASNRALTRTHLRYALGALCVYSVLYGLTQWLEAGRGMSPREAGLLLLPMSGLAAILAWPVSRRNLVRLPLIAAAAACLVASAGVLFLAANTPIIWIAIITLGFGVTLGCVVSANQTMLYQQVPAEQIGTASGLFKTFGSIGSIASSAVIAITFHAGANDADLHLLAVIMIIVSALGAVLVFADRSIMTYHRTIRTR
ncbi:MFS transporter [Leifsonia poae]|uniref:MFS transporter n=1 Tax=Leifsonia poae TaxID=110933 RepID=UPI001CBFC25C|nr:MFS transporter [Leifsonia poae]